MSLLRSYKLEDFLPKVNYGQKPGEAWNPGAREDVYQQMERARQDAGFAQQFAADIILSKEGSGKKAYDVTGKEVAMNKGYLYTQHSLNASKSWAGQAFDTPAMKGADGNWYTAFSQLDMTAGTKKYRGAGRDSTNIYDMPTYSPGNAKGFGFVQGDKITDKNLIQRLNEGAVAFTAKGANGQTVYVPYSTGFIPKKEEGGRPEAGNYKDYSDRDGVKRDAHTANTVDPGVVGDPMGLRQTLLGGAMAQQRQRKTLLG